MDNPTRAEEMNRLLFELLARWVSGLIPGCALLHIMCKTKRPGDERPPVTRNSRCGVWLPYVWVGGVGYGYRFSIVSIGLENTLFCKSKHGEKVLDKRGG